VYRNIKQYPEAEVYQGILMVRIDAPIYFANTQNVREKLNKYEQRAEAETAATCGIGIKFLVLELSPVSYVDTSALHILHDMTKAYKGRGIQLCLSNPSVSVMERFIKSGLVDEVGREHFFVTIHDAVTWCLNHQDVIESTLEVESEQSDVESQQAIEMMA
jgi:sulfate transporter 4